MPMNRSRILLYESDKTLVYLYPDNTYGRPVAIKVLRSDTFGSQQFRYLSNELEFTKDLEIPGVRKSFDVVDIDDKPALVMEYISGKTLKQLIAVNGIPLVELIKIAIQIAQTVQDVHNDDIIHRNITSDNILVEEKSNRPVLIDFGLAVRFDLPIEQLSNPESSPVYLEYISPEQTGRMNKKVDYRSDLYSLGVTFYEMLTGRLPFEKKEPLALVHAHLAVSPTPLKAVKSSVPTKVSDLVLKLLSKNAEDRYQSAFGLRVDLERCLEYLQSPTGSLNPEGLSFVLGESDFSKRFHIPQKLFGRSTELDSLFSAFERTALGSCELMTVSGNPGVGKSALVAEIYKPVMEKKGYFVSAKFDQYRDNIPYAAFIQTFTQLAELITTESEDIVREYRKRITEACGSNCSVLTEFVTRLEEVIGTYPAVPKLDGQENLNRFNFTVQKFVNAVSTKEHPLVLFIDDWQWADLASLELLKVLFSDHSNSHFLFIIAYRDNEVSSAHPLNRILTEIEKSGRRIITIKLEPLKEKYINQLIADSLSCSIDQALPLSRIVFGMARGNPFFNNQFLKSLYLEGLLTYDSERECWVCDTAHVADLNLTDDVVRFMALQLQKLFPETRSILILASCIGGLFDLETVALASQKSVRDTIVDLHRAVQEGFVYPIDDAHSSTTTTYKFIHDRVQQAAYSLISEDQRQSMHFDIGTLMLKNTPAEELEEKIFEIVNHLNLGKNLVNDPAGKIELARLNLRAGQKATSTAAFAAAWNYYQIGLSLLPDDSWQSMYMLTLALHNSAVETAYYIGDFDTMRELSERVFKEAESLLETVRVYEINIKSLAAQNKLLEAIDTGLLFLKQLCIEFPEKPSESDIATALEETRSSYLGKEIADLIDLPLMTDLKRLAAMRILICISPASFLASPLLFVLLTLKEVYLSVKYGNTPSSAHCYSTYGLLMCAAFGDIDSGYQFGRMALDLIVKLDAKEVQSRVHLLVYGFIFHWKNHVGDMLAPLHAAYQTGLETGDLEFAGYSAVLYCCFPYYAGLDKSISELQREAFVFSEAVAGLKQITSFQYIQMNRQALHFLKEGRSNTQLLSGQFYDEKSMLPLHIDANDRNALFYLHTHKLMLSYLLGDYAQAVKDADEVEQYLDGGVGFPYVPVYYFFDSLTRMAAYRENRANGSDKLLARIEANQEKLNNWAQYAPMNCLHRYHLVEAVRNHLFGDKWKAMTFFDQSITGAKNSGHTRDEAMANDCAVQFFFDNGNNKVALMYLREACIGYERWGAEAIIAEMEKRFAKSMPDGWTIDNIRTGRKDRFILTGEKPFHEDVGRSLDLASFVKVGDAISSEIELGRLLEQLMRISIENAGAQRGALIMEQSGDWIVEAIGDINNSEVKVLLGRPVGISDMVSPKIISHVVRSGESVILDNASIDGRFMDDPYVARNDVKSVICMPLLSRSRISSIIYLENNLVCGAFISDRLGLLNILSTQMALSLDNARLYEKARREIAERKNAEEEIGRLNQDLEKRIEERTEQLRYANKELEAFSYSVSHDLRTPLRAIEGYTRILFEDYRESLDDEGKRVCDVISSETKRMGQLIDDLLSFSRLSRSEIRRTTINMNEMVNSVFSKSCAPERKEKIQFVVGEIPVAKGDKDLIRQVWTNLISNAIKFTSKKDHPSIEIAGKSENGEVVYSIRDNGAGFDMRYAHKLFGVFQRLHSFHEFEGTGVGLAIVQRIIHRHGGRIRAESELDKGAIFYFTLPNI